MSSIAEFYRGKNVFITGATGFLGKVIIEKLLRSCPDIGFVYVLMRPKRDQNIEKRLSGITSGPLFEKLREKDPEQLKKLISVAGDLESDNLGISCQDRLILIENVSIVIHSAASVSFNEPLKKTVRINVEATRDILNLCREMKSLQVFVHVSSNYISGNNLSWSEKLNPPKLTPEEVIELVERSSAEELKKRESEIITGYPNTYLFTKSLTEALICSEVKKDNLPVAILRPSIILGTMKEPIPGYLDNTYGPTILGILTSKGILHVVSCDGKANVPIIPADLASNAIISAAWKTALDRSSGIIYNICSSSENSTDYKFLMSAYLKSSFDYPLSSNPAWYPTTTLRKNIFTFYIHMIVAHYVPAAIYDLIDIFKGNKPKSLKASLRVREITKMLAFFSTNSFQFSSENLPKLMSSMSESDRIEFNCDSKSIRWKEYLIDCVRGIRKYLLRKPDETIMEDRMKIQRLKPLHYFVKYTFLFLFWTLVAGTIFKLSSFRFFMFIMLAYSIIWSIRLASPEDAVYDLFDLDF